MTRISNILVIVDPTAADQPAVAKGAELAHRLNARLELFACETKASRQMRLAAHARTEPGRPFVASSKALAESFAQPLRERGLDVATEFDCGEPLHAVLIERAKRSHAQLVVKDTHHHSLAQRTFMSNTDWNLIRGCPVPLLLTKQRPWPAAPRIMAAVDPSHANDKPAALDHRILDEASAYAQALRAELHVVHAYIPLAVVAAATGGGAPMAISVSPEDMRTEAETRRKQIDDLVSAYRVQPAHIHVEMGGPGDVLPRIAEQVEADVVVMGAISRSGLKRIFLGATAEDVLERLPCDALVVKPPDFSDAIPF